MTLLTNWNRRVVEMGTELITMRARSENAVGLCHGGADSPYRSDLAISN